jgi:hypothetical protein
MVFPALRRGAVCSVLFVVLGCGSIRDAPRAGTGGSGASPGTGGMPAAGASDAGGGSNTGGENGGGDPSVCHASNLSTAPLQCLQDWPHATARYESQCSTTGGYQASCDLYDAIVYRSGSTNVWCYYDTTTSNLIGARKTENADGTGGTCVFFDTSFTEPDTASCAPVSGGAC